MNSELSSVFEDDGWTKYASPIHPRSFLRIASTLMIAAFFLFASLIVYDLIICLTYNRYMINTPTKKRNLLREVLLALMSAVFSGFGIVFFFMWTGNYL